MRERCFKFLVVFFFLFKSTLNAQEKIPHFFRPNTPNYGLKAQAKRLIIKNDLFYQQYPSSFKLSQIPGSCYTDNLGFFCKRELELEKLLTIPLRFRLGSLEYVDYLERKPNARRF